MMMMMIIKNWQMKYVLCGSKIQLKWSRS